ncbi:protein suppressor of hairy wing-like isoform X2 [Corythoichthys intestinalis]|uniref:protein suppressor of hairy wing-like isoform X2 n=1 Tax=Corythoichthys intestinalis TaxID=161448 RepID=UPI0025A59192|nr:protein suppressor of hairy wing-like isoform X2 [Corythoichthys intestinalis]
MNGRKMGQLEQLKMFISERLKTVASEILGAVEKTVTEYEKEACRLMEENKRHCSVLDLLVQANKSPRKEASFVVPKLSSERQHGATGHLGSQEMQRSNSSEATVSSYIDNARVHEQISHNVVEILQTKQKKAGAEAQVQIIKSLKTEPDELKIQQFPASGPVLSSPPHLEGAFTSYKDFINFAMGSKCPFCMRTVQATELHLGRRHYSAAIHYNENGIERFIVPCACKELIQSRSHWHCPYCKKILTRRVNFEGHIANKHHYPIRNPSQRPDIREMAIVPTSDAWSQQDLPTTSLLPLQNEQNQYLGAHSNQDSPFNIVFVDTSVQQLNQMEIPALDSTDPPSKKRKTKKSKRKTLSLKAKRNNTEVYRCHVCAKSFHYSYTLRSHVWTHLGNASVCGICGRQLKDAESLLPHLESHTVVKKCGLCGKMFSSVARLKDHWRLHTGNP